MEPPESKPVDTLVLVPTTSSSRPQGVRAPPPVGRMLGVTNGGALEFYKLVISWFFLVFLVFFFPLFFFFFVELSDQRH